MKNQTIFYLVILSSLFLILAFLLGVKSGTNHIACELHIPYGSTEGKIHIINVADQEECNYLFTYGNEGGLNFWFDPFNSDDHNTYVYIIGGEK